MKKILPLLTVLILVLFCPLTGLNAQSDEAAKKRDLVFEDEKSTDSGVVKGAVEGEESQGTTGVKVTLELDRDGKISTVLPSHVFKTGDKVRLLYSTNINCYVYWMSEGTSGDYYMLFPNPKVGLDNWVEKNKMYTIPSKKGASFRFQGPKGVEKILLIMSPEKLPELEEAAREAAVKGGKVQESSSQIAAVKEDQSSKRASRDLVFEETENQETGVTTKTQVSKDINQPFVVNIDLVHQ